jgi:hypothetical protein
VVWAEHPLPNAERALIKRFRLIESFLVCVHARQIQQRCGEIGMFRAERLLPNFDGAPEQRIGLGVSAEPFIYVSQVVEACCHVGMVGA